MAREITVDNIRFTVIQELQCTVDSEGEYHKSEIDTACCWPGQGEVASLSVLSGQFHPTARIKAEYVGGGSFPEELKRWRAGYAQNVTAFVREGVYEDPPGKVIGTINFLQQYPLPIRDGEPAEFPFEESGMAFRPGEVAEVDDGADAPGPTFPMNLSTNNDHPIQAELRETKGGDDFVTWLTLAREKKAGEASVDRACIVLIGRVTWHSYFDTRRASGDKVKFTLAPLINIEAPVQCDPLQAIYTRGEFTQLPLYPDLRANASANEFHYGEERSGNYILKWVINDDDEAVKYQQRKAPEDATNFLP